MLRAEARRPDRSAGTTQWRRQLLKRGAAGLAAGVAVAATRAGPLEARPALQGSTTVPAGRVAATLAAIDTLAAGALARTGVPGMAVAVVHNDQQVFARGYGVRASAGSDPVDADTVFRLASMSKPLSGTLSAALVGDGRTDWDARVSDIMPDLKMWDPWVTRELTIRDCLCHRSGLLAYDGDAFNDLGFDRDQILHQLRHYRPAHSFRSTFSYNNIICTLGNVAATRAAGMAWEDASVERLFTPLGMSRTRVRYADFLATPNRAPEHVRVGGTWQHLYESPVDANAPADNISSSVNDLSRWMRMQLAAGRLEGRQVVAAGALGETHRPHIISGVPADPNGPASFHGLGWGVDYVAGGLLQLSHSGAFTYGAATTVALRPAAGLGVVVLTNAFPIGLPEAIVASFWDLIDTGSLTQDWVDVVGKAFASFIGSVAGGQDYSTPPPSPVPARPPAAYAGSYTSELYGPLTIVERDGGLVLQIGPRPNRYPLRHYTGDVFAFPRITPGSQPSTLSGMTFTVGPDGAATRVLIDELNDNGQGLWTRTPASR